MSSSIRFDQNVSREMRDGALLAGKFYLPGDGEKYRAIIMRTLYSGERMAGGSISHLFTQGHRIRIDITRPIMVLP
jgi:predicted acyl esterase